MSLEPLASPSDLADRIQGGTLTSDELGAVGALLLDASAAVRDAAKQTFSEETSTVWVKVRRGLVRLPQRPVTAVSAVVDVYGNSVAYTWLGDDRLLLSLGADAINAWEIEPYRTPLGEVKVTYTHGDDDAIPDLPKAITCSVVLRALGRDPKDGALTGEGIEGYNYQVGAVGAAGPVGLLPEEKLRLESYGRPHGFSRQ